MTITTQELIIRLVLAAILGAIIGLDRRLHSKPAGLRTMSLVSLGAATFTLVGISAMLQLVNAEQEAGLQQMLRLDTSRVIAGIVGGIGFLGAGAIIQSRGRVQGMTTASGIWMTAAIGVAVGLGQYALAFCATFLAFVILVLLKRSVEEDS
ncbi:MAG: magnesium transporter MgtC [Phycisphaerae bacterium]|nr:magnesium transporter MgtC [Phycisphaerae bacterium]MCH2146540.1 MgtC/SapB family protein [Phycisphaerales bacterium]